MSWYLFAVLSFIFSAFYNVLAKVGATKMNVFAANITIGTAAAVVAVAVFFVGAPLSSITASGAGPLIYSVLSGLSVGISGTLYMVALSKSAPVSVILPTVFGGSIILTAILGVLILGESMSYLKAAGLVSMIIGLILVSK